MTNFPRLPYLDSGQRGALALGALLLFVLLVTFVGAVRIYDQLHEAASSQRRLVSAQEQLDVVLRAQYDEEIALRGYRATQKEYFQGSKSSASDEFDKAIHDLEASTRSLGHTELVALTNEMAALHRQWEDRVADPLLVQVPPKNADRIQGVGKILADRIRSDARALGNQLDHYIDVAQTDLAHRINETLVVAVVAILVFGVLGIAFVAARHRMLARLERERRIIETLQGAFRTGWDTLPRSRVGTAYVSATRDAAVGGDLFDVRRLDRDRGLLIVADISGKGIEAAVNTAFVKYSIRTLALSHEDPGEILDAFNRMFLDTIKDPSLFVVVFVGIFDARTARLTYASGGHAGAYLRRGSDVSQLAVTGPIVGLQRDFAYATQTLQLQPRDLLVLATDGLTEARDRHGNALEDAGAIRLLQECPVEPQACADQLVQAIRRRGGGRIVDDLALLVIAVDDVKRDRAALSSEAAA